MVNRTNSQTLAALTRYAESDDNALVVFYGSPYIDRNAVLDALTRDRACFCYRAGCVSDREQRMRLGSELRARGLAVSDNPPYAELFAKLFSLAPVRERFLVLLDNFEYFFYENSDFLQVLAELTAAPENDGRLFVLLLSDDEVWVENALVERAGRYAAAISGFVKKRESRFLELRAAWPDFSMRDALSLYAVFGGETALWPFIDPGKSLKENLCALFLAPDATAVLKELAMRRLRDLVREPAVYATILANLAAGREKLNDLYHATGIPRAKLSVYLKTLMAPGYVEKVFSYGSVGTTQTKKGMYRIANAFLRFYFTAIYPHESALFKTTPDKFYDLYLAPALSDVAAITFQKICMEYVERLDEQGRLPFAIADEGEWNGKAGTIDIVAESETGETLIGICVYKNIVTEEDYHFALQYAGQAGLSPDYCFLFSGEGFSAELTAAARNVTGLRLIGLEELERG